MTTTTTDGPASDMTTSLGERVRYRAVLVGLLEPDGTAFDCFERVDCFEIGGAWSIGPAHALASLAEMIGMVEDSDGEAFEQAYGIALEYAQSGARTMLDEHADSPERWAIWCMDEPAHDVYVPRVDERDDDSRR